MKAITTTGRALGLAAAVAVLALSGCGNPGTPAAPTTQEQTASAQPTATGTASATFSPGPSTTAASAEILIKGFKYEGTETVSPGATVTVTNGDSEAHSITADTGNAFDAIIKVGAATFTAPTEPGTYAYHCSFHGNMKGTLTVK